MEKRFLSVLIFSALYILGATIFYIANGNTEFLTYVGVLIIVGIVIGLTLRTSKLDAFALWLLSIWGLLHMLGGSLPIGDTVLYGWKIFPFIDNGGDFFILKMDQVIHFYGFFTAAVVMYQLIARRAIKGTHAAMLIFFATVASMGLGALNEVIEFIAWLSIEHTGVGDMYNVGLDLIFNTVGAFAGACFSQFIYGKENSVSKQKLKKFISKKKN